MFQKTAEQDSLQGAITSYFADDLPTFVNSFHGDDVLGVEDHISRQFVVSTYKATPACGSSQLQQLMH